MLYFNCWDVKNALSPDPVISGWTKLTYTRVTGTPDKWLLAPYSSRASFLFKSNHVTSLLKTLQWLLLTVGIKSKVLPRAPSRSLRGSLLPSLPLSHSLTPSWLFLQHVGFLSSLPQNSRLPPPGIALPNLPRLALSVTGLTFCKSSQTILWKQPSNHQPCLHSLSSFPSLIFVYAIIIIWNYIVYSLLSLFIISLPHWNVNSTREGAFLS